MISLGANSDRPSWGKDISILGLNLNLVLFKTQEDSFYPR